MTPGRKALDKRDQSVRLRQGPLSAVFRTYLSASSVSPVLTWAVAQAAHSPSVEAANKEFLGASRAQARATQ